MTAASVLAVAIRVFASLSLQAAQSAGVAHSPAVAAARSFVDETQAALRAAQGFGAPQIVAGYLEAPQGGSLGEQIAQRLTSAGAQVTIGEALARGASVRRAQENLLGAQFALQDAQRTTRVAIVASYFGALRGSATVALRQAALVSAQADRSAARKRFSAGAVPRLDVVRADVAVATAQADLETAQAAARNALDALSVYTAEPEQALARIVPSTLPTKPALPNVDRVVARALLLRPDVAAAKAAVSAQEAAVRVAQRQRFPPLTIGAGYESGVDSGVKVHGLTASVSLAIPLSHAARNRVTEERARLAQAQDRLDAVKRQVRIEVSAAVRSYQASVRVTEAAARAGSEAQRELRAVESGYREGASSSLDVTNARQTAVTAALNALDARYAQAQARATLDVLIGVK